MAKLLISTFCVLGLGSASWTEQSHDYSPSTSAEIANGIKSKL